MQQEDSTTENVSENKPRSADSINARREARRKRILEGSNSRLSKIVGRDYKEEPVVIGNISNTEFFSDPEIERDVFESSTFRENRNGNFNEYNDMFEFINNLKQSANINQNEQSTQVQKQKSKFAKILNTKLHLAITSIIVYFLYASGNQYITSNSVFLYLLIWEAAEVFILKTYIPKQSNIMGIFFLIAGDSPQYAAFIKVYETLMKIFRDLVVYIFVFVATHILYQTLGNGLTINEVLRTNIIV